MKKTMSILSTLLLVGILTLSSCSGNEDSETPVALSSQNVSSSGAKTGTLGNTTSKAIDGGGVGFAFDLGRASKGCMGFGVCRLAAFWITIIWNKDATRANYPYTGLIRESYSDPSKYAAYIELNNTMDPNQYDTSLFYVDEDIDVNNKYVIKAGVYQLDNSIGDYGGYELSVTKTN
ncbi:hypothetical protein [Chryseobacterium sp.]|uniref:hypothetical protein n=1 Tax=Chryseobacterium sp. TaxID=1871047 RepID=UPI0025C634C0|nr:hypothetical protein [Chryseobacterium sp.]